MNKSGYTITEVKLLTEAHAKAKAAEKSNGRLIPEIGVQFGAESGATGHAKTTFFGKRKADAANRLRIRGDLIYVTQCSDNLRGFRATTIYYRLSDAMKARLDAEDAALEDSDAQNVETHASPS